MKVTRFLRHLSRESARPYFYADENREAQLKRERACCEAKEIAKRQQFIIKQNSIGDCETQKISGSGYSL